MNLEGKNVFISGGAHRIGRLIALSAASLGANIVLHFGKSEQEAEETAEEIKKFGSQVLSIQQDLAEQEKIKDLISEISKKWPLHILVNNASIFASLSFMETKLDDWERHIQINLTAPFLLSQAFAEQYNYGNGGKIINLLDWRAFRPGKDHFPYTISKSGLVGLTKAMAVSLAPRISVNGLALGAILPPVGGGNDEKIISPVPMQRWALQEELEDTIKFLLTAPDYITGEVIHLDGGRHLV